MTVRVIGLGQRFGGDDAVGLDVLDSLRKHPISKDLELCEVRDASALIDALVTPGRAIVVDAVLGQGTPGQIHLLSPAQLGEGGLAAVSTHGLDVRQAMALAAALYPDTLSPDIRLVGIEISQAQRFEQGLSPEVGAAVKQALHAVLKLATS